MTNRLVLWMTGQSNSWGVDPGEAYVNAGNPGTYANVDYWDTLLSSIDCEAFRPLDGSHGKDRTVGRLLYEAGFNPVIINISKGSTYSNQWIPNHPYYQLYIAEVAEVYPILVARFPGDTFTHIHIRDQGEEEARYDTSTPAGLAVVTNWSENFELTHGALQNIIGPAERIIIQTNSNIVGKTSPGLLEGEQLTAAGSYLRFVDRNSVAYEINGIHMTTPGYISCGTLVAQQVQRLLWDKSKQSRSLPSHTLSFGL
ncbi:MAG TPA: hypothetical protein VL494_13800 [Steroidobacteraceae bacterium]|nr:hypothetical protein [Steroidobacteraceae bacterium]